MQADPPAQPSPSAPPIAGGEAVSHTLGVSGGGQMPVHPILPVARSGIKFLGPVEASLASLGGSDLLYLVP